MSSFFGFDPSKPPPQIHNQKGPGFGQTPDPFAGFGNQAEDDDAETFDFEDSYDDYLDAQLEEKDDAFNDDTFGAGPIGTDFNFSQGGGPSQPITQQQQGQRSVHQPYPARQSSPPRQPPKPARTGYEGYKQPSRMPDLAPSASIWGPATTRPELRQQLSHGPQPSIATATKKMMSLEEVEAMMRFGSKKPTTNTPSHDSSSRPPPPDVAPPHTRIPSMPNQSQALQRPQLPDQHLSEGPSFENLAIRGQPGGTPQPRYSGPPQPQRYEGTPRQLQVHVRDHPHGQEALQQPPPQSRQILQNPQRVSQPGQDRSMPGSATVFASNVHQRGPSIGGRPITHPDQVTQLPEAERAAFLLDEANRAKRNHKIHVLSKDNGLMTPQDKNFITRIQLQQLVTATGGTDDAGPESMLAEDFYYQVFTQIRGAPRQDNHFAQTYLDQLAWKGGGNRRTVRGGENHMRRMEQQVQRAVDAAKARPKNKQLVVEGSLGKISFSNAKTPKPLLNLKRQENQDTKTPPNTGRARQQDTTAGRKAVLRDIEAVYGSLMKMEDHERRMPLPPREESPADVIQEYMEWRQQAQRLNRALWNDLKVPEPIVPNSPVPHPFIAIISHPKGKKLIPPVFRQIDDQQRLTILTIIVVQLDMVDVIRFAQPSSTGGTIPASIRAEIDLFAQAVEPSLFAYITDAPLANVIGLVGILTTRVNLSTVVTTRTGINLLTRLISRAAIVQQTGHADPQETTQWASTYDRLFDLLEPQLQYIWQTPVVGGDASDFSNWQFLAALGIVAGPEQQQRLVLAVKDRVMETVSYAKGLDEAEGKPKLDMVNLFMRAIGLDVDLLG